MREELLTALEILIDDSMGHTLAIDLEEDQVPPAVKEPPRDPRHLMGVRTMNESPGIEGRRRILARIPGGIGLARGRDVVEGRQTLSHCTLTRTRSA